jgi:ATP-binding cassette subfamily C (CFTR/MRP) protein 1
MLIYVVVDANVGKSLFHNAILGLIQQGKTVILVTHALHFLSQCHYIYTLEGGRISEHGSYQDLLAKNGEFARLDKEFGGGGHVDDDTEGLVTITTTVEELKIKSERAGGTGKIEGKLITKERRTTGSVSWRGEHLECPV